MIDRSPDHIGTHHHPRATTGRRVIHHAMTPEPELPQVPALAELVKSIGQKAD